MIYKVHSGRNFHIKTSGDRSKPHLLLLHGYMESGSVFDHLIEKLTEKFYVIVPDLPGHGNSHKIKFHFTFEEFAEDLIEVLDRMSIETITFVGHSMGGYIGQALSAKHPKRIDHLYLLNSATWTVRPEYVKLKEREKKFIALGKKNLLVKNSIPEGFAPENRENLSSFIENIYNEATNLSDRCIEFTIEAMQKRKSYAKELSIENVPTTILVGRHDAVAPIEKIEEDFVNWKNAKIIIFENSGHHIFAEEEREFLKVFDL